MKFEIKLKTDKAYDSYAEFVRLVNGFLFDEVAIKKFIHSGDGIEVQMTYTRHGQTMKDLPHVIFSREEFAEARAVTAGDFTKLAQTRMVERLFSEGSVAFLGSQAKAEVDALADMDFIESLKQS